MSRPLSLAILIAAFVIVGCGGSDPAVNENTVATENKNENSVATENKNTGQNINIYDQPGGSDNSSVSRGGNQSAPNNSVTPETPSSSQSSASNRPLSSRPDTTLGSQSTATNSIGSPNVSTLNSNRPGDNRSASSSRPVNSRLPTTASTPRPPSSSVNRPTPPRQ